MGWKDNALMYWNDSGTWRKITDHNRSPLTVSVERIENKQRMVDGTLRRYVVTKKRTYSCSWTSLPSKNSQVYAGKTGLSTVDGGWSGDDMENFHDATDGSFQMKLRVGIDEAKAISDGTIEVVTVMITDFSKDIVKRGVTDYWDVSITLEEV